MTRYYFNLKRYSSETSSLPAEPPEIVLQAFNISGDGNSEGEIKDPQQWEYLELKKYCEQYPEMIFTLDWEADDIGRYYFKGSQYHIVMMEYPPFNPSKLEEFTGEE